jgi:hypothetical protein
VYISRKSFFLTLVACGLALTAWSVEQPSQSQDEKAGSALIPGLEKKLDALTEILIENGPRTVVMKQEKDARWVLPEMQNYPVDMARLRAFLLDLSQATLLEKKTAREENHPTLNLDDLHAIQVTLSTAKGVMGEVLLGKTSERRQATYARYPFDAQTWLVRGRLQPSADLKQWVRQEVLHIPQERIRGVVFEHGNGETLSLHRDAAEASFTVMPATPQKSQAVDYQLNTLPRIYSHLNLVDVQSAQALSSSSRDVTTVQTFDGMHVHFRFSSDAPDDTQRWVVVHAEAAEDAPAEVQKEAEAINLRTQGWAYRFAPYIMTQFRMRTDTFAKETAQP